MADQSGHDRSDASSSPAPKHVQFSRDKRPSLSATTSPHGSASLRPSSPRRVSRYIDAALERDNDEQSPLLRPGSSEGAGLLPPSSGLTSPRSEDSWLAGESAEESKSTIYLILLTIAIIGLQIGWSVELSYGSPYLLGLGISKSLLALVWIAGPLSGTLVQPYVGIKSDRCRSRFGKRRPFMVGGAIATVLSLLALAWTKELIGGLLSIFGVSTDSTATKYASITFAVVMVYVLDFSINVIQAAVRAFIVDNAPTHQQESANAWASRLSGIGHIVGYLFGYVDLPKYFGFIGDTQFKDLCVIGGIIMLSTVAISCVSIKERDPRAEGEPTGPSGGVITFFRDIYHSMRKLPDQIKRVCAVQFFAWIGWFPFLFYITTYVGEIYVDPIFANNPNMTPEEVDKEWEKGTRVATFALFIFAICTFLCSVFIPLIVAASFRPPTPAPRTPMVPSAKASAPSRPLRTPVTPTTPNGTAGSYSIPTPKPYTEESDYFGPIATSKDVLRACWGRLPSPELRWLTLRRAWLLSHIIFAVLTWATLFVRDTTGATIIVTLIGVPWSMTNWAPFALIAAEISKRDSIRRGVIRPPPTHDGELLSRGEDPSDGADQAGVVLGIHNVAIAAPQVIATLGSSVIFRFLQKPRGTPGDDSVAWVLRFGGLAALVAAYLTTKVHEEGKA